MALTLGTVWKAAQKSKRRRNEESLEDYAARLTHLNLSRRGISELTTLHHCQRLLMLSLYDNRIVRMQSLHNCIHLTQLHLQNNRIRRLEGISRLRALKKLFIGNNELIVIEGLHLLPNLSELYMENQRLPPGEAIIFDPRTVLALRKTLRVLNLAGNRLESLDDLGALQTIEELDVSNNNISNLANLLQFMRNNTDLRKLNVAGNPFCMLYKYREEIISSSFNLTELDGEEITPVMRSFLMNWKNARQKQGGLPPSRPREPSDPYKPPLFKRQGVTLAPAFPSRLRGAPRNLPPLSGSPSVGQQAKR